MRLVFLKLLLVVVLGAPSEGSDRKFYAGPSIQYLYNSTPWLGDLISVGVEGGAKILGTSWGKIAVEGAFGLPVTSGTNDLVDGDWSVSWVTGSLAYRTPGRLFAKVNIGYSYTWFEFDPEYSYKSSESHGIVLGGALGYGVSDRFELLLDAWIISEFNDIDDEIVGHLSRYGFSCLARF